MDDAVQKRAPGASTTPPPSPSHSPSTPPPSTDGGEPRYTLVEARRILTERECREAGHDLQQQWVTDGTKSVVFCGRCGETFEPPALPPLPPASELRQDVYHAGGRHSLQLTHIYTGLVATIEGCDTMRESRQRAELLLRARLLVAQLERAATG